MPGRDAYFMGLALEQARAAQRQGEVPVGAVVVWGDKVVGSGHNRVITDHDPSAHAEIVALRQAAHTLGNYRLDGCTLYVSLEPCAMCRGAVQHARIRRLVYGARDSHGMGADGQQIDAGGAAPLTPGVAHCEIQDTSVADACAAVLRGFFQERRRVQAQCKAPLRDDALRCEEHTREKLCTELWPAKGHYLAPPLAALDGLRMHVWHHGSFPPADTMRPLVLCLHGHASWALQFHTLLHGTGAGARDWLLVDRPGHGWSDKSKKGWEHRPELQIAALAELLQRYGHPCIDVVAHDGAAPLAWALAQRVPRVRSLNLLHPCPYGGMPPSAQGRGEGDGPGTIDWARVTTLAGWKRWCLPAPDDGGQDAQRLRECLPLPLPDDGHIRGWSRYLRGARASLDGGVATPFFHAGPVPCPVRILCAESGLPYVQAFCDQCGLAPEGYTLDVDNASNCGMARWAASPPWS